MSCFEDAKRVQKELWNKTPELYLNELKRRFEQINNEEYALSYSGGRDSHFIYYFIKHILQDNKIKIVFVNTRMAHPEIRKRATANADVVLLPKFKCHEITKKYGQPCFNKKQDEYIKRYQGGLRSKNCLDVVLRRNPVIKLTKKASELLLSGQLHKISNVCCDWLKKKPLKKYQKDNNKKAIYGVRGAESKNRVSTYKHYFKDNGDFVPIFDMTDEMLIYFEDKFNIEVPKVYDYLDRTGCMGCPYGWHCQEELDLMNQAQRNYCNICFDKSYKVKGIDVFKETSPNNSKKNLDEVKNG